MFYSSKAVAQSSLNQETSVVVREESSISAIATQTSAEIEKEVLVLIESGLAAKKSCFKPGEYLTFHNALIAATSANNLAQPFLAPSNCEQNGNSVIVSCVNVAITQLTQVTKLYNNYKEARDLQIKFLNVLPYTNIETCSAIDKDGNIVLMEEPLNPETVSNFIKQHGKANFKMSGLEISFSLKYTGFWQDKKGPIAAVFFSGASTAFYLAMNLSNEANSLIGPTASSVLNVTQSIPLISSVDTLNSMFVSHQMDVYEATVKIFEFYYKSKKLEELTEEMIGSLSSFMSSEGMGKIRTKLRELRESDVEAGNRGTSTARLVM